MNKKQHFNVEDKSAATFQFELTALDAKRTDEGAYSIAYYMK